MIWTLWGSGHDINSLYLRISCHNIYPISHVHTVLIDRCAFLYAFVIDDSMCFPSMFIQTIVDIYSSTSKAKKLFFPMYIYRSRLFYIAIGSKNSPEPSTGTSKRSQGEASTTAPTFSAMLVAEETFADAIAAVDPSSGANDVDPNVTPPLSLHAMIESFMTTQATHG